MLQWILEYMWLFKLWFSQGVYPVVRFLGHMVLIKKECASYQTIALISQASRVMIKILDARLQHYVNQQLPDVQAGFRKGKGTRDQIANIHGITEKAREFQKTSTSVSSITPKALTVWIIIKCGKLLKRWEYQTILPVSWETCMWVKKH